MISKLRLFVESSLFILLPVLLSIWAFPLYALLRVSSRASHLWFSYVFPPLTNHFKPNFKDIVPALFALLKDDESGDHDLRREGAIRILEIGSGLGGNFRFFPSGAKVISVDINPHFEKYIEANREKFPDVNIEQCVVGSAEDMSQVKSGSVDVVVGTHILCSIENPSQAIGEVRRVLRPGTGKYYLLEHVGDRHSSLINLIQTLIEPLWKVFVGGCKLKEDTERLLQQGGFNTTGLRYLNVDGMPITVRPHIFGVAALN